MAQDMQEQDFTDQSMCPVVDLVVSVLQPYSLGSEGTSDMVLPVLRDNELGLLQFDIIIPFSPTMTEHPVFAVMDAVSRNIIPINSRFKVNGVAVFTADMLDGEPGIVSRLEVDSMERVLEHVNGGELNGTEALASD
ncbi:hypothetical protein BG006_003355 [Podila minutissima]|uniref:Uncharacterized protein n=1 Tax=Podila minutissima TaxID=64525 RepID=A0A9P5S974_9FUNG|nr:hypothetical protein BG006_003355 [Podila minutissima]